MMNALLTALLASGASFVIGLVQRDATTTGFYYWGFSLSAQAVFVLVTNLQGVLFPVLTKLNGDLQRQFSAVERACRLLLSVAAPMCVLQYLLAAPFITLLFQERWQPAIGVAQWISLGLLCQPLYLVATSVLMARGQFRRLAAITGLSAVATMLAAGAGAMLGDQLVIARCVGLSLLAANTIAGWMVYQEFDRSWTHLWRAVAPILGMTAALAVFGEWMNRATANHGGLGQILLTTFAGLLFYGTLMKFFLPDVVADIIRRITHRREQPVARPSSGDDTSEIWP